MQAYTVASDTAPEAMCVDCTHNMGTTQLLPAAMLAGVLSYIWAESGQRLGWVGMDDVGGVGDAGTGPDSRAYHLEVGRTSFWPLAMHGQPRAEPSRAPWQHDHSQAIGADKRQQAGSRPRDHIQACAYACQPAPTRSPHADTTAAHCLVSSVVGARQACLQDVQGASHVPTPQGHQRVHAAVLELHAATAPPDQGAAEAVS